MTAFNTTLLREKFTIHDALPQDISDREPVIALSNRMSLALRGEDDGESEVLVVRAQTMHLCVRVAARLAREFQDHGSLADRAKSFDFGSIWDGATKGYEQEWNRNRWVAVYHKGRVIFEGGPGERHSFLDIIEQCDARNKGDYEKAMIVAQDAFKQAGRLVTIEHDSNVALVLNATEEEGRCGIIVRGPSRATTFNMTARKKTEEDKGSVIPVSQYLSAAAAFLEGIQLCFMIGMTAEKLNYEMIGKNSDEAKQADDARTRIAQLQAAITQFENTLSVSYRPERPNFHDLIEDAEAFARKILLS